MANTRGNNEDSGKFYFSGLLNHCRQWLHHEIKRCLLLGRKAMTNLCSIIKSFANITLPTKAHIVRAMVFPAIMYEHESWAIKRLSTKELMLLNCSPGGDSWESLGLQGDQPVNPKRNQPWIFTGRTNAEGEAPILWLPVVKSWLTGKDLDAGVYWGQEEKGIIEDELVQWHHQLNTHEFEKTLGDSEGQGSLACSKSMGSQSQTQLDNWTTTYRYFNDQVFLDCKWQRLNSKSLGINGYFVTHGS